MEPRAETIIETIKKNNIEGLKNFLLSNEYPSVLVGWFSIAIDENRLECATLCLEKLTESYKAIVAQGNTTENKELLNVSKIQVEKSSPEVKEIWNKFWHEHKIQPREKQALPESAFDNSLVTFKSSNKQDLEKQQKEREKQQKKQEERIKNIRGTEEGL
jgi:hypothetical protein